MNKCTMPGTLVRRTGPLILLLFTSLASAELILPSGERNLEACLAAVMQQQQGQVVKVEMRDADQGLVYEFDVRAPDGRDWDIVCAVDSATITEVEEEVTGVGHPSFAAGKRLSEFSARAIALDAYPGEITEVEYELEENGNPTYEFDIVQADGSEVKVEVDAVSGEIIEAFTEHWQLGYE